MEFFSFQNHKYPMSDSTSKRNVSHPNRCLNWKCFSAENVERKKQIFTLHFLPFLTKVYRHNFCSLHTEWHGKFSRQNYFPLASTNIRKIQLFCDLCNCQVITLKYSFSAVAGKTPEWCYEWTEEIRETRLVAERAKIQVEVEEVCSELNTQGRNFLSLAFVEFFREGEISQTLDLCSNVNVYQNICSNFSDNITFLSHKTLLWF